MKRMKDGNIYNFFFGKKNSSESSTSSPSPNVGSAQASNEPRSHETPPINASQTQETDTAPQNQENGTRQESVPHVKRARLSSFDAMSLPHDPARRVKISDHHVNDQTPVRKAYIDRGPCQTKSHVFPQRDIGGVLRQFKVEWFEDYKPWLEYSISKDAAFCFKCYLFKEDNVAAGNAFVGGGFRSWNKPEYFEKHIGDHNSAHNKAVRAYDTFINPKASIGSAFSKQSQQSSLAYGIRLKAVGKCVRLLLHQGLAFRGHDESESSTNKGNFRELLEFVCDINEDIGKVLLKNAPGNNKMIAPTIQKEMINACAKEITKAIIEELDDDLFCILVDESADIAKKEQMAICLRYVNNKGEVTERFLSVQHIPNTNALTLKNAITSVLDVYKLSTTRIRGQGYDGASNMSGSLNGLKTLILRESPSAYFVHCFAHQLQLTLIVVSKKSKDCTWLFETLSDLLNLVGSSSKRMEMLRVKQTQELAKALEVGEVTTGKGKNKELGLSRAGDTRWGSHYKSILNVMSLFPTVLDVLENIEELVTVPADKLKAEHLTFAVESFDFVFVAYLMISIFGITNDLNNALQKRGQDIVNAMKYVDVTKRQLQKMRDNGWEAHVEKVSSFCVKHKIDVPNMDGLYVRPGRKNRRALKTTNIHHFQVELFLQVIDLQLQELDNRFNEVAKELLICMACFCPDDNFASFDTNKLVKLAGFYPSEFSSIDLVSLEFQLNNFIEDVRTDDNFKNLKTINELSIKMVETKKHWTYTKVYLLLKLVLLLPVATSSVERVFSAMTYIKNKLRNKMGDEFLNDCMVAYIERDVLSSIKLKNILLRFQNMKTRRLDLSDL